MKRLLRTLVVLTAALCGALSTASAQPLELVEVEVLTSIEPAAASGMVIRPEGIRQPIPASAARVSKEVVVVRFAIRAEERNAKNFVSAVVRDAGGNLAFAQVKPLTPEVPLRSWTDLPTCPNDTSQLNIVQGDYSTVQRLVEFRTARRKVLHEKLRVILQGRLLERLRQLESSFGISQSAPLSPELHPLEITDRLTRLNAAVRNYRETKLRDSESTATPPE